MHPLYTASKWLWQGLEYSALAKAEGIAQEELARLGWGQAELAGRRKGAPRKVMIAARLRRETTMTLSWIAARLQMGAPAPAAHLLYRQGQKMVACENTLFFTA